MTFENQQFDAVGAGVFNDALFKIGGAGRVDWNFTGQRSAEQKREESHARILITSLLKSDFLEQRVPRIAKLRFQPIHRQRPVRIRRANGL